MGGGGALGASPHGLINTALVCCLFLGHTLHMPAHFLEGLCRGFMHADRWFSVVLQRAHLPHNTPLLCNHKYPAYDHHHHHDGVPCCPVCAPQAVNLPHLEAAADEEAEGAEAQQGSKQAPRKQKKKGTARPKRQSPPAEPQQLALIRHLRLRRAAGAAGDTAALMAAAADDARLPPLAGLSKVEAAQAILDLFQVRGACTACATATLGLIAWRLHVHAGA